MLCFKFKVMFFMCIEYFDLSHFKLIKFSNYKTNNTFGLTKLNLKNAIPTDSLEDLTLAGGKHSCI